MRKIRKKTRKNCSFKRKQEKKKDIKIDMIRCGLVYLF